MEIGLIAQEVEKVVPEVVRVVDSNNKLAVGYPQLVSLLIEAIKEQNAKIVSLEDRINEHFKSSTSSIRDYSILELDKIDTTSVLYQNSPNPFNKETVIRYLLEISVKTASLMIFDMQGTLIKSIPIKNLDESRLVLSAGDLKAGMYFYSLLADGKEIGTKKMIITEE